MPADTSCVTLEGPWTHRLVQANGAQFHLAYAGQYSSDKPLVLLVHGFPQFWWAWRHQIAPLAQAGYRVAAIDRRGVGGSDKTPDSADGLTLTQDLVALVRTLGATKAAIVGHGRGGALAWSAVSMCPELFAGLMTVSSPHPRTLHRIGTHLTFRTWRHVLGTGIRQISRRALLSEDFLTHILNEWSAPGNDGASSQSRIYAQALHLPAAADLAVDQLRWIYLAQRTPSGREYLRQSAHPVHLPIWAVRGELDPLLPGRAWEKDLEFARGVYHKVSIHNCGHFVPEEQPEEFTATLLEFLASLSL